MKEKVIKQELNESINEPIYVKPDIEVIDLEVQESFHAASPIPPFTKFNLIN